MCNATKQEIKKNSKEAGIFSVVVLFMLTGLGFYAVNRLNEPAHSDACSTGKPAFWALSNFYFSIFGGGIGALYELYLLLIDKVFEVETIAVIPRIRGFNAGYIFSVGLMFDAFMVLGSNNAELLNIVMFSLATICPLVAPGLAFPGKQQTIGNIFFGATTIISMLIIFFKGCAYGGDQVKYLLAGSKLMSALGAIFTPPNKSLRNNIQFHCLRFVANCMVVASYFLSQSESPCFPQESEEQISSKLLPALGASVVLGWIVNVSVSSNSSVKSKKS